MNISKVFNYKNVLFVLTYSFLRSDINDTCSGRIFFNGVPTGPLINGSVVWISPTSSNPNDVVFSMNTSGSDMIIMSDPGNLTASGVIQAGTTSFPVAYSRLGTGTATNANIDASNDLLINGSLEVKNGIYWSPKNNYIGYLPSDFTSNFDTYTYTRSSASLYKRIGDTSAQYWYAPVHLPDGAVITEFRVWFRDSSALEDLNVTIRRRAYGFIGVSTEIAVIQTSGTPGESNLTDDTIIFATIDNSNYVYFVYIDFPSTDISSNLIFRHAKITYTTSGM